MLPPVLCLPLTQPKDANQVIFISETKILLKFPNMPNFKNDNNRVKSLDLKYRTGQVIVWL